MTTDATMTVNAPIKAQPTGQPYPDRYVLVFGPRLNASGVAKIFVGANSYSDGEVYTLVYNCGRGRYVARTYLRDQQGIYTDARCPATVIAETVDAAMIALADPDAIVAVPVPVAGELLPDLTFAEDGRHPSLGTAMVP